MNQNQLFFSKNSPCVSPATSLNMDESIANIGNISRYHNQHIDEKEIQNKCQFCGLQMSTETELKDHQVNYHPGKIFALE